MVGKSINRRTEDFTPIQKFGIKHNLKQTEETWKTVSRGYTRPSLVNHMYYQFPVIKNRYELPRNRGKYEEMVRDSRCTCESEVGIEGRDKVQKKTKTTDGKKT